MGIVELNLVLVNELPKDVSSNLKIICDSVRINIRWSKFSTNLIELITTKVENFFPGCLIGGVLHNIGNQSKFTSQITSKLIHDPFCGTMLIVLFDKSLKAKTELMEVCFKHDSLIGSFFFSIWRFTFWFSRSTINAESSRSRSYQIH